MSLLEEKIKKAAFPLLSRISERFSPPELEANARLLIAGLADFFKEEQENTRVGELLKICRTLDEAGFFPGKSGNISILNSANTFLITPSGKRKLDLSSADLVEMDFVGRVISGSNRPSSEAKMHCAIYEDRPEIKAIVHAHPPFATGFAAAGIPLDAPVLPEAILVLGKIALVEYATPGTWEVPRSLTPYLKRGDNSFLLANHGALTLGESLSQAAHRMETLEMFARVLLISRLLGGEKLLSQSDLEKLAKTHPLQKES